MFNLINFRSNKSKLNLKVLNCEFKKTKLNRNLIKNIIKNLIKNLF